MLGAERRTSGTSDAPQIVEVHLSHEFFLFI